ncbi:PAS domain S-box protein [Alkalihalobacillus sp. MEB130]|uniref:PAS domain S-box protein n=1 Tax=Alkalihalobacillus sp. MEB130 TaxID=2976704 RepID=UPI0028DD6CF0|nr:PAS domain S-box protein [Alkalihalobacillus sp. MEB130]MDT8858752.1 PAS domain S-box protein [Alkalihalobacillus sp. MEB130]
MTVFFKELLTKDVGSIFKVMRDVFDSMNEMMVLMEVEQNSFRYLAANKAATEKLGIGTDAIGKTFEESRSPALVAFIKPMYEKVVQETEPIVFEEEILLHDEALIFETSLTPIVSEKGECRYILSVSRDVTERINRETVLQRAKKQVEESEQRFNSLFYENEDAVFVLDSKGYFVEANDVVETIIGYTEEELKSRSFLMLLPHSHRKKVMSYFQETLKGSSRSYETQALHKRGDILDFRIKNVPIKVDGKIVGIYGIAKDITKQKRVEREMEDVREELQLIWNHTSDAIFTLDHKGLILHANPAFEMMFGWTLEELKGQHVSAIFENAESQYANIVMNGKNVLNQVVRKRRKDGTSIDVIGSYLPIHHRKIHAIATYTDITEETKIQQSLQRSEERYRKLVELLPEPIVVHRDETIVYVNPACTSFLGGKDQQELRGESIWRLIHSESTEKIKKRLSHLTSSTNKEERTENVDMKFKRLDGSVVSAEVSSVKVEFNGQPAIQSVLRDTTKQKLYEKQLEYLAYRDPLTELVNRRMFHDILNRLVEEENVERMFAVLYLDLDKFKEANDQYGHEVGDELLKLVARRVVTSIRESDVACRVGGDEFIVLLKEVGNKQETIAIAERILQSLNQLYVVKEKHLTITSSMGISLYPQDGKSTKTLIRHADLALYEAKTKRNDYKFYENDKS